MTKSNHNAQNFHQLCQVTIEALLKRAMFETTFIKKSVSERAGFQNLAIYIVYRDRFLLVDLLEVGG